jgi:hypothetical protein
MAQATQGAAVAVISASELAYFALLLASYCTAMVHGVGEPIMAGLPSDHDAALLRSLG